MPFLFVLIPIIWPFVWLQGIFITSVFCLYFLSYDLPKTFHLPSSIFCPSIHTSFTSVFHIPHLCSFALFLLLSFYHLSIIPCLPFPDLDNSTFHSLWLCESSFTFSILHHLPYYSESCSTCIKFFQFVPTSPACNCCLPLQKYNPPLSPLLV